MDLNKNYFSKNCIFVIYLSVNSSCVCPLVTNDHWWIICFKCLVYNLLNAVFWHAVNIVFVTYEILSYSSYSENVFITFNSNAIHMYYFIYFNESLKNSMTNFENVISRRNMSFLNRNIFVPSEYIFRLTRVIIYKCWNKWLVKITLAHYFKY